MYSFKMKRIFFVSIIMILFIAPANSTEWTAVSANHHAKFFVNEKSIKREGGYIYFWDMGNLLGPIGEGIVSISSFNKVNCENFLVKTLNTSFHKAPMANDNPEVLTATRPTWKQPPSGSASAKIAKFVCDF